MPHIIRKLSQNEYIRIILKGLICTKMKYKTMVKRGGLSSGVKFCINIEETSFGNVRKGLIWKCWGGVKMWVSLYHFMSGIHSNIYKNTHKPMNWFLHNIYLKTTHQSQKGWTITIIFPSIQTYYVKEFLNDLMNWWLNSLTTT